MAAEQCRRYHADSGARCQLPFGHGGDHWHRRPDGSEFTFPGWASCPPPKKKDYSIAPKTGAAGLVGT